MTLPYTQSRWSLADLFPAQNSPEVQKAFQDLESQAAAFEAHRSQLVDTIDPEDFLDIIKEYEKMSSLAYHLGGFASLSFASDTQDQNALTFQAQVSPGVTTAQVLSIPFTIQDGLGHTLQPVLSVIANGRAVYLPLMAR